MGTRAQILEAASCSEAPRGPRLLPVPRCPLSTGLNRTDPATHRLLEATEFSSGQCQSSGKSSLQAF